MIDNKNIKKVEENIKIKKQQVNDLSLNKAKQEIREKQEIEPNKIEQNKTEKNSVVTQETKVFQPIKNVAIKKEVVTEKNKDTTQIEEEKNKKASKKMVEKENDVTRFEKVNHENKKSKKKILIIFIIILFILLIYTLFTLFNIKNNKIIYGVYINNIDVSNLTKEEAIEKIQKQIINNENNIISVHKNNYYKEIKLEDIEGQYNIVSAVDSAYNIGRESDIFQNNNKVILTLIKNEKINMEFSYNNELYTNLVRELSMEIPELSPDYSYKIEGNKLIIKNSVEGLKIDKAKLIEQLREGFITDKKNFEIPVGYCEKEKINLENIYKEIYKEPVDAYFVKEPFELVKEVKGLDFAISLKDAEKLLLEEKEEYIIPLKETEPKVTLKDLDSEAFPDVISTFTTKYGTGDANRTTNIALAAKSINNVVLMPGETFSYNDLIGECSAKTGYKAATIYLNGKLATGIGGGICQVSTTMYNAALRANLEIVQRRNHSLGVTYVPYGHDAMVSIGTQDFKFKNNRDYPIKVVAYVGTGSVTCQIHGLKQDVEYEVKLQSRTLLNTETKCKVETYKVLYLDGKEVSRTWLSTDTYKKH